MDAHIRWLRRLLVAKIVRRLFVEASVVGTLVAGAALGASLEPALSVLLVIGAAQTYALGRVVFALVANPVNHRYLMDWDDLSLGLTPMPPEGTRGQHHRFLEQVGFRPLVDLAGPGDGPGAQVYLALSGLVAVSAGEHGEPFVVLSRLSDERLLVTAAETIPPHSGLVLNQATGASLSDLIEEHVRRLDFLQGAGIDPQQLDDKAVVEQLHLEWDAWEQLGPFIGPFLAVDRRLQPLTLQTRVSPQVLWDRTVEAQEPIVSISGPVNGRSQPVPAASGSQPGPSPDTPAW